MSPETTSRRRRRQLAGEDDFRPETTESSVARDFSPETTTSRRRGRLFTGRRRRAVSPEILETSVTREEESCVTGEDIRALPEKTSERLAGEEDSSSKVYMTFVRRNASDILSRRHRPGHLSIAGDV
ncbi:unnamed protein product [Linum trigynum]|uniref:Uncharacterized protein n=1 Tax=Linum trigynum TaxID=586398 RepID=A0AAV2E0Y3_9ROSI